MKKENIERAKEKVAQANRKMREADEIINKITEAQDLQNLESQLNELE